MLATVMNELDAPGNAIPAWRDRPALQQPAYPDAEALAAVGADLRSRPPLVFAGEVDALRAQMAAAAQGRAFVLMGGDCAESFEAGSATSIRLKVQTILQMAAVLTYAASTPVVKIGRMAGQYAKPRSVETETREGLTLPSYRGDSVNGHAFTAQARTPDPARMLEAYLRSGTTLNLVRAFTMGGYADLREVHSWNRGFTANPAYKRFESFAGEIDRAMRFMEAAGVDFEALRQVDFYAAHEALLLEYEDAMIRQDSRTGRLYGTSAHLLWVGERTRGAEDAHVALLEGIHNPVGVKIGPSTTPQELIDLIDHLNPAGEPGRLSLITRMGAERIRQALPPLIEAVRGDGRPVTWITDPMHGNTITSDNGYKTRRFDTIMEEVRGFFEVHREMGTVPGGIHVELTGDDVTECLGGGEHIDEAALARRYETLVDPRLNHQQSLEMAFEVAELLR
ncbi:3-deoxy-7-phosphoheptulonate synthase class II [Actinomyces bowdenii]|uniref:Phospho-2-dehydro-3-deoxyheptonate aldolase n=2 Tax=Actinomyces bowdenii TaxID=131109 RepID=A0A3P1V5Q2_9ACTO|nr:3-deoxy-7-phosphoheptulonate synthase class II [Actinomyces bowdenii]MBO3725186.1 3-deoxy-7-phosphoheptulonate synthase class II [Actinomyces bowdenii]RRD29128.1 3-deoxy-7-phosphoheptulonate synthase class II [Actinomyces bowdenii]